MSQSPAANAATPVAASPVTSTPASPPTSIAMSAPTSAARVRESLYGLLPAIYRRGDLANGEPLRALFAVLETQLERLRDELGAQYENWFVETCEPWTLPYLGRLLGDPHAETDYGAWSDPRAWVGWLQEMRCWQGTPGAIERAVHAITGWRAHVNEFQRQVSVLQRVDAVQPQRSRLVDVRQTNSLRQCGGPFNEVTHGVDVRRIEDGRSRFGLNSLGIFLWRLTAEPVTAVQPASNGHPGCFMMNPLGVDSPLFHRPSPVSATSRDVRPEHFPCPIDPRQAVESLAGLYGEQLSFSIRWRGRLVPETAVAACELKGDCAEPWRALRIDQQVASLETDDEMPQFLVDVARGRLFVAKAVGSGDRRRWHPIECSSRDLQISAYRGTAAAIGGGAYDRRQTLIAPGSSRQSGYEFMELNACDLGEHVRAFSDSAEVERRTLLRIVDSGTFATDEPLTIRLPTVGWLVIEADDRARPCLSGVAGPLRLRIEGGGRDSLVILNGLLIRGTVELMIASDGDDAASGGDRLASGGPLNVHVRHSTVTGGIRVRGESSLESLANNEAPGLDPDELPLGVHIENSIVGPIRLPAESLGVTIRDSIVQHRNLVPADRGATDSDSDAGLAIGGTPGDADFGPALAIHRSTVLGRIRVRQVNEAQDVLGTGLAEAERLDVGYVRHCFFSPGSLGLPPTQVRSPAFHSLRFGDPRFAQLKPANDPSVLAGASDGAELGAFGAASQQKRVNELRKMLDELIPVHLQPGLFFET